MFRLYVNGVLWEEHVRCDPAFDAWRCWHGRGFNARLSFPSAIGVTEPLIAEIGSVRSQGATRVAAAAAREAKTIEMNNVVDLADDKTDPSVDLEDTQLIE